MKGPGLKGTNALLTGASRGLGVYIARALWKSGSNLLLVARTESALSELKRDLLKEQTPGQQIEILAADLADHDTPERILAVAKKLWKKVDVLINNAGIQGPIGKSWENSWDEWQMTIQINLLSPVAMCRAFIPWMIQTGGGKVINLSGGGATNARPNFSAYASAKAALVRFSETLAKETLRFNIQVNCIAPGGMNTAMLEAIRKAGPEKAGPEEFQAAMECLNNGDSVLKRAAALCCYLASAESNGLTGKLISAVWDPWDQLADHLEELNESDIYTLRRIRPEDRGKVW